MTIAEFLLELATSEELLRNFYADPESVIRGDSRLTDAQRQLLLAGKLRDLQVEVTAKFEIDDEIVAFGTVYVPPITVYGAPSEDE